MMTFWAMGSTPARCENAAVAVEPNWLFDPSIPGPDAPPQGVSLFDRVTTHQGTSAQGRREVPFPFDRLIQRFEAAAGCSATAPCVRSVLLPLGRSLQRVAASPDYFRFPRVVSGVVASGKGPWLLRDRLYVGYQERAGMLEVISYNELQGRFEFQLVKNYRAGAQPQVFQARRTVCIACHQNHGPIFPRQVWDETNANAVIANRLAEQHETYLGIPARGSTDIANALDDATDRSNRIALTRRLWNEGCGDGAAADRCRASAFSAALQLALTGGRAHQPNIRDLSERLQANAASTWPGGIALPNPDLPNRDPLALLNSGVGLAAAHVPARLEPLLPRAPLEVIPADGGLLASSLITGIADSFPAFAIDELSGAMGSHAAKPARRRSYRSHCEVTSSPAVTRFDCYGEAALTGTFDGSFATVDSLRVGDGSVVRNLYLPARRVASKAIIVTPKFRNRALRLPDGNAVTELSIDSDATLDIGVVEDFSFARPLIAKALAESTRESHARRVERVTAGLQGKVLDVEPALTTISIVEPSAVYEDAIPLTAPFESRCGSCHRTPETSPPNFLSGDASRVQQALRACAPRILVRLAMSDLPAAQRQKTPMPPDTMRGHEPQPFAADMRVLRTRVESMLRDEYGQVPRLDDLLRAGYENLRPCLPGNP